MDKLVHRTDSINGKVRKTLHDANDEVPRQQKTFKFCFRSQNCKSYSLTQKR